MDPMAGAATTATPTAAPTRRPRQEPQLRHRHRHGADRVRPSPEPSTAVALLDGGFGGTGPAATRTSHAGRQRPDAPLDTASATAPSARRPSSRRPTRCPFFHTTRLRQVPDRPNIESGRRVLRDALVPHVAGRAASSTRASAAPVNVESVDRQHRALPARAQRRVQPRHGQAAAARVADDPEPVPRPERRRPEGPDQAWRSPRSTTRWRC